MKLVYVLGRGRSGSTVFANVLGELEGFFAGGEIRCLWDPVVRRASLCGCGLPIMECEVWSRVLDKLADVNVDDVSGWQHEIVKEHHTYRLLRHRRGRRWDALERYAEVMGRLYRALGEVTGARVIVDSSKRPSYAAFLRSVTGVDPYYVHLVREPRASAYSWKTRRHESVQGDGHEVVRRGAFDATLRWDLLNLGSEAILRRAGAAHALQIRYEDFVARPKEHLEMVRSLLGEPIGPSPFLDEHTVNLGPNHTIAGNPSRFLTGTVHLEDKREWSRGQRRIDRWIATTVALPFLRRYGYPIRT